MKQMTWNKSRGLTLTELLAVLMILSLLTTIAVPVYVSRQEDARVRVAITECRQIAMAEETVAAMHGFYVPFQLLDDLPPRADGTTPSDEERIDTNPDANLLQLIIPTESALEQYNGTQLVLGQGYETAVGGPSHPLVRKMVLNWSGPFLNFQRFWYNTSSAVYAGPSDPAYRTDFDMFRDYPLDPWGNPYRFYSALGVVGGGQDHDGEDFDFETPDINFSNGEITNDDDDRFQKWAVVSFGRDGVSDTWPTAPTADDILNDIVYEFGTDGVSRNFGRF